MHICYNGITFTTMEVEAFHHDAVYDDSKTDFLGYRTFIQCTAIVNGLAEPRRLADPPMSYRARGDQLKPRHEEADRTRPPGQPRADDGPTPPTTDTGARQFGAFRDRAREEAFPYTATTFSPTATPPAFAKDSSMVLVLDPLPNPPVLTETLIRSRLMEPRGQLFVFAGTGEAPGELLLHSPGWGRHCDVRNGPIPASFEIMQIHGDGATFVVRWACETLINEQNRTKNLDPLLSNRFRMTHIVGEDSFLTIQVTGQAIFDIGKLHERAINPDAYRPQLMLPIPIGFVRGNIMVDGMEGMEGVRYSYVDRQLAINFPAAPYVKAAAISAEHKQYIDCTGDPFLQGIGAFDGYLQRQWLLRQARAEKAGEDAAAARAKAASLPIFLRGIDPK